jgi:formimidoylglutamate deiminase
MQLRFSGLLQKSGWISPAFVLLTAEGKVSAVSSNPFPQEPVEAIDGYAVPGFQNAHSHAFQYAMAGKAEQHPAGMDDDFWSWREAMYHCALTPDPDQAEAIATMVYTEMVRAGYTHVAEFHYLHHDKNGSPYEDPAEMGLRMLRAAQRAGIGITLIPVLYQQGGFGLPPTLRQRRFISQDADSFLKLFEASAAHVEKFPDARIAWSAHSLRAVDPEALKIIFRQMPEIPFHIHAAEQKKEVTDSLDYCGRRPVQWLLDNLPVNENFFIVHATHLDDIEVRDLAASGATVVLCPGTEGNLGDGIFRMKDYVAAGGRWCIGTDSHITIDPLAEFRMIDYRQRLITNRRNTFEGDSALYMLETALFNGRRAMGIKSNEYFAAGSSFDAVIFDAKHPLTSTADNNERLSVLLYASGSDSKIGTMRGGKWVFRG